MSMQILTEQQLVILLAVFGQPLYSVYFQKKKLLIFSLNLSVLALISVFGQSLVLIFQEEI